MGGPMPLENVCPICEKPAQDAYKPFCSRRCADVDLSRWLSGRYAIPAEEDGPPSEQGGNLDED